MANKFQKSVLERLEAEAARQKEQPVAAPGTERTRKPEAQSKVPAEITPVRPEPVRTAPDWSAYLRAEPQRVAKNKTFYLDADVIEAVKRAAREQGCTDSRLVNDILRGVLGIEGVR